MSNEIFGKEISGRYTIPSGIVMTSVPVLERFSHDIPELGILTTKSISLKPRDGNIEPILAQTGPGSFVNAVGLANPGAEKFAEQLSKINIPKKRFLLASIIGASVKDFKEVAEILSNNVDGFELNVSCPHATEEGQIIGQDYDLVSEIIKSVKSIGKPVVVKLSPKLNIEESVKAILKGGADGVAAINTWGPEDFTIDGYPVLSNLKGSFSGKAILEKGIRFVGEFRKRTSLPIIGSGGISIVNDVFRYKEAGADFFSIGTALAGMNNAEIKKYFMTLSKDVENGTNNAESLLKTELDMEYKKIKVDKKEQLADDLFLLRFKENMEANAGQFVMMGQLGKGGEKPFSVYNTDPFEVLFQIRGCRTKEMAKLEKGDGIYVRGPHGNSPDVKGKLLLVGGGMGIAALKLFTKDYKNTVVVAGVKDNNHLPNINNWETSETIIYSNDGSVGIKGNATDDLEQIIINHQPDYMLACGPKGMLDEVIRRGSLLMPKENILISEELPTMCGVGICGRCATKDGRRNCVDGTFI